MSSDSWQCISFGCSENSTSSRSLPFTILTLCLQDLYIFIYLFISGKKNVAPMFMFYPPTWEPSYSCHATFLIWWHQKWSELLVRAAGRPHWSAGQLGRARVDLRWNSALLPCQRRDKGGTFFHGLLMMSSGSVLFFSALVITLWILLWIMWRFSLIRVMYSVLYWIFIFHLSLLWSSLMLLITA